MAHFQGHNAAHANSAVSNSQVIPLIYGEGPGECESQYRPDVHAYREDKRAPYGSSRPAELPSNGHPNYKPGPLRWPLLCGMIVALLGMMAATEWACRTLPVEESRRPLPTTPISQTPAATSSSSVFPLVRYQKSASEGHSTTVALSDTVRISRKHCCRCNADASCRNRIPQLQMARKLVCSQKATSAMMGQYQ